MAKPSSPSGNKTTQVPLNEELTTAHIAQGLAKGQVGSSPSTGEGANSQAPASSANINQTKTGSKN
jgi:hypothetical protein